MKNSILLLFFTFFGLSLQAQSYSYAVDVLGLTFEIPRAEQGIENGWYEATVKYFNYNTYTRSTYTLDVKVEYNRVTVISFGNGGSIHSGYNNSDYYYNGGYLSFERNYDYKIIAANTKVTITEGNGNIITYEVRIE